MTKTQFEPSIRSRPVYGELAPRPALAHLLVADGEGGEALADLVAKADAGFLANARIVYVPGANGTDLTDKVRALGAAQFHRSPSYTAAVPRLKKVIDGDDPGGITEAVSVAAGDNVTLRVQGMGSTSLRFV